MISEHAQGEPQADPVLARYLSYLEHDMTAHPGRIVPLDPDRVRRAQDLVADVEIDIDARLKEEQG